MLITFSNCSIPVWKLRTGVVVAYETLMHITYGNIESLNIKEGSEPLINIVVGSKKMTMKPKDIIWVDPA